MILDQSQYAAFAQAGRFGGGSVWTYLAAVTQVLGPYRIVATDYHVAGAVAGDYHVAGAVAADSHVAGAVAGDSF